MAKVEPRYLASDIKIYTFRELMLRTPRMYLGSKLDTQAIHRLVLAVVEDAVDPKTLNEPTSLRLTIRADGSVELTDDGRGLPVAPITLWGWMTPECPLEASMIRPLYNHPNEFHYHHFGFLFLYGSFLNVLSAHLRVDSYIDGGHYCIGCSRGDIIERVQRLSSSAEHGTQIHFQPDPEIFADVQWNHQILHRGLLRLAHNFPLVRYELYDERLTLAVVLPPIARLDPGLELDHLKESTAPGVNMLDNKDSAPDEPLRLMADYLNGLALWSLSDDGLWRPLGHSLYPYESWPELSHKLWTWNNKLWLSAENCEQLDFEAFNQEGRALAKEVKARVGMDTYVEYVPVGGDSWIGQPEKIGSTGQISSEVQALAECH